MQGQCTNKRPRVLIVSSGDGHLEVFVDGVADVKVVRVPASFSHQAECQALEVAELLLPQRWREVWRAPNLKAVSTTRPLLPSTLAASMEVPGILEEIDSLPKRIRNRCKLARERRSA